LNLQFGIAYKIFDIKKLRIKLGPEINRLYFSSHRSFTDEILIESEFRIGINALLSMEANLNPNSGMDFNFAYGYIPETSLNVDKKRYWKIRLLMTFL
jgi:hypothetical protein